MPLRSGLRRPQSGLLHPPVPSSFLPGWRHSHNKNSSRLRSGSHRLLPGLRPLQADFPRLSVYPWQFSVLFWRHPASVLLLQVLFHHHPAPFWHLPASAGSPRSQRTRHPALPALPGGRTQSGYHSGRLQWHPAGPPHFSLCPHTFQSLIRVLLLPIRVPQPLYIRPEKNFRLG